MSTENRTEQHQFNEATRQALIKAPATEAGLREAVKAFSKEEALAAANHMAESFPDKALLIGEILDNRHLIDLAARIIVNAGDQYGENLIARARKYYTTPEF